MYAHYLSYGGFSVLGITDLSCSSTSSCGIKSRIMNQSAIKAAIETHTQSQVFVWLLRLCMCRNVSQQLFFSSNFLYNTSEY